MVKQTTQTKILRAIVALFVWFALVPFAHAVTGITYQGRILKPNGQPVNGTLVQFTVQVRSPISTDCLFYEETQTIDMSDSKGLFSFTLADGNGIRNVAADGGTYGLDQIFANRSTFNFAPGLCNSGATTYTPALGDNRVLTVKFQDETMGAAEDMPVQAINFVPMAIEAKQVAGFPATSLLRFAESNGTLVNTAPLNNAQYTELLALLAGTSTRFDKLNGAPISGTPSNGNVLTWDNTGGSWVASDPVASVQAFAKTAMPTCAAGEFLKNNGSGLFVCTTPANSGGTVTLVGTGTGLTGGGFSTTGTISIAPGGVGTTELAADAVTTGKIADGTITGADLAANISISTSGSVVATNVSSTIAATRELQLVDPDDPAVTAKRVKMVAPLAIAADYTLTWPLDDGGVNQVLTTDGSGNLTWTNPSAGSVTNIVTGTGLTGGPITSTGTISIAPLGVSAAELAAGAVTTAKITDKNVTFAKIQDLNTQKLLGRATASTGSAEEISIGTGLNLSVGGILTATGIQAIVGSALGNTKIWIGDGSGNAQEFALSGDISMTAGGVVTVGLVGTSTAANVHAAELLANAATPANTNDAIVKRDSSGNFVASSGKFTNSVILRDGATGGEITLSAPTAFTSYGLTFPTTDGNSGEYLTTNGTGVLTWTSPGAAVVTNAASLALTKIWIGDASGKAQEFAVSGDATMSAGGVITVGSVGGSSAALINSAELLANAATSSNTNNAIVKRGAAGEFASGAITATSVTAGAIRATASMNVDPTALPGAATAGSIAIDSGDSNKLKYYNGSNWQTLGTSTPVVSGTAALANTKIWVGSAGGVAQEFALSGDTTMTAGGVVTVGSVGGSTAALINSAELLANAATSSNTNNAIVKRGAAGEFSAGAITSGAINSGAITATSVRATAGMQVDPTALPGAATAGVIAVDVAASNSLKWYNGSTWLTVADTTSNGGDFYKNGTVAMTGTLRALPGTAAGPGVTFSGMTSTGMFETGSDILGFSTASSERMRILANGNVGIGTTAPNRLLEVAGPLRLSPSTLPSGGAAGDLFFDSASGNVMKYYNGSNWQTVGTSTPVVTGTAALANTKIWIGDGTGKAQEFAVSGDATMSAGGLVTVGSVGGSTAALVNSAELLANAATSSNTNNAIVKRGAAGEFSAGAITSGAVTATSVQTTTGGLKIGPTALTTGATGGEMVVDVGAANALKWYNGSNWLTVGTGNGNGDFLKDGSLAMTGTLKHLPGTAAGPGLTFSGMTSTGIFETGTNILGVSTAGAERMRVDASGNVGIGTSTPNRLLEVAGPVRFSPSALPTGGSAGDLFFDSGSGNVMKYYNGSNWQTVGTSTPVVTGTAALANTKIWIGSAGGVAQEFALSGDATMTAGGLVTVGSVGGSTAALVNSAELLANAATSSNTNNAIVKRGAAGEFSAGAITSGAVVATSLRATNGMQVDPTALPGAATAGVIAIDSSASNSLKWYNGSTWLTVADTTTGGGDFYKNGSAAMTGSLKILPGTSGGPGLTFAGNTNTGIFSQGTNVINFATNGNTIAFMNSSQFSMATGAGDAPVLKPASGTAALPNYTFSSSSGTGFYTSSANVLGVSTSGAERMRIDASGNVGIGTTTPNRLLEVAGPVRFSPSTIPSGGAAGDIYFDSGSGNVMKYYNGSNWQTVGTSTPVVTGTASLANTKIWIGDGSGKAQEFALSGDATMTAGGLVTVGSVGGSTAALVNSAELLANAATSSNTNNAIVKRGASGQFSAGAITATSVQTTTGGLKIGPTALTAGATGGEMVVDVGAANALKWYNGSNWQTVGTGNGNGDFLKDGTLAMTGTLKHLAGTAAGPGLTFSGMTSTGIFETGTDILGVSTAGTERMRILADGKIGIGTSTPNRLLEVAGPIRLSPSAIPSGGAAGDIYFDSGSGNVMKYYNGSNWQTIGTSTPVVTGTAALANTKIWIGSAGGVAQEFALSGDATMTAGGLVTVGSVGGSTAALVNSAELLANAATSSNTNNAIVKRGAAGEFSAGAITSGAVTATSVQTTTGGLKIGPTALTTGATGGEMVVDVGAANALKWYNGSNWQTVGTGNGNGDFLKDGSLAMTGTLKHLPGTAAGPGLTFSGMTSTGIFETGTNILGVSTAGAERMRVDASGNVGIGTSTPNRLLEVAGPVRFSPSAIPSGGAAGDIYFDSGSGNVMKYYNGSNWQTVGTSTPVVTGTAALTNTKIWIGDGSGKAQEFALSGDATMTAGGLVTVGSVGGSTAALVNSAELLANAATSAATNNAIVKRGASGQFSAGAITATSVQTTTGGLKIGPTALTAGATGGEMVVDVGAANALKWYNGSNWLTVGTGNGNGDFLKDGTLAMTGTLRALPGSAAGPGLTFSGMTSTGIFETGTNILGVSTAGAERMRVDASGNVGIGTSTPNRLLEVAGPIRLSPSTIPSGGAAGDIYFDSGSGNVMKYYNGSNWQTIGTSTPVVTGTAALANTKIWIGSAGGVAQEFALSGDATMTAGGLVTVGSVGGSTAALVNSAELLANAATSAATNNAIVKRGASGQFSAGAITATSVQTTTGGLKIGPTALTAGATGGEMVVDVGAANALKWYNGSNWLTVGTGNGNGDFLKDGTLAMTGTLKALPGSAAGPGVTFSGMTSTGIFETGTDILGVSTAGVERMRVDASGNVGMGTTSPADSLHIVGAANGSGSGHVIVQNTTNGGAATGSFIARNNASVDFEFGSAASTYSSLTAIPGGASYLTSGSAAGISMVSSHATGGFRFYTAGSTAADEKMRITSAGNLGVGTTTPTRLLHVAGAMRMSPTAMPTSGQAGDMYVDVGASNSLKWYNGSNWQTVGTGNGNGDFLKDGSLAMTGTLRALPGSAAGPGVTFSGMTSTGIFETGTNILGVSTAGAERMRVDASGNVGIGTSTPNRLLEVAGPVRFSPSAIPSGGSAGDIFFDSASGNVMKYYNGSNWQTVGTSTPTVTGAAALANTKIWIGSAGGVAQEFALSGDATMTAGGLVTVGSVGGSTAALVNSAELLANAATSAATNNAIVKRGASGQFSAGAITATSVQTTTGGLKIGPTALTTGATGGEMVVDVGAANALKWYNGSNWLTVGTGNGNGDFLKDGTIAMTGTLKALPGTAAGPGLTFSGMTSTGIFETGTNILGVSTAGAERMRVDASGQVGIGTSTPNRLLEVAGPIRLSPSTIPSSGAAGDIYFDSGSGNVMKYYNGSNWQTVGTSTPTVTGAAALANTKIWIGSAGGVAQEFALSGDATMTAGGLVTVGSVGGSTAALVNSAELLANAATSAATNNAIVKRGASGQFSAGAITATSVQTTTGGLKIGPTALTAGATGGEMVVDVGAANALKWYNGSNWQTVGTGNGNGDFLKDGTIAMTGTLKHLAGTAAGPGLTFSGMTSTGIFETGTNILGVSTAGAERMRVDASGNVGIGTSTPNRLLEVAGPVRFSPSAIPSSGAAGDIYFDSGSGNVMKYYNGSNWQTVGTSTPTVTGAAALANTKIWIGSAGGVAQEFALSGDATMTAGGLVTVGSVGGSTAALVNSAELLANAATSAATNNAIVKRGASGQFSAGAITATSVQTTTGGLKIGPTALTAGATGGEMVVDVGAANALKWYNGSNWQTVGTGNGNGDFLKDGTIAMTGTLKHLAGTAAGPGLTFAGYTGTGMFETGTDILGFSTAGAERMRIDASGNLGLGVSPTASIDVFKSQNAATQIRIQNGTSGASADTQFMAINNSSDVALVGIKSATSTAYGAISAGEAYVMGSGTSLTLMADKAATGVLKFATGGSAEKMRIDASGNVGIGTTTPTRLLHVAGAMRLSPAAMPTSGQAGDMYVDVGAANSLKWYNGSNWLTVVDTSTGGGDFQKNGTIAMTGTLRALPGTAAGPGVTFSGMTSTGMFETGTDNLGFSTAGVERMRFDAAGMVGIGTTTPGSELDVVGTIRGKQSNGGSIVAGLESNNSNASVNIGQGALVKLSNATVQLATVAGAYEDGSGNNGYMTLNVRNTGMREGMRILSNGSVGIGTTAPTAPLDVYAATGTGIAFHNSTSGATGADGSSIGMSSGSSDLGIWNQENAAMYFATNNTERMRILNSGNLGIGTSTPTRLLHVAGAMRMSPTTMPTSGQAGDMYVDQGASNSLKWYNGSNWLTVVDTSTGGGDFLKNGSIAMTGTIKGLSGSVGAPGFTFNGDTTTGIYSGTAGTVSVAANGIQAFKVTSQASGVNFLGAASAITTSAPILSAEGSDTNIDLKILSKGTGGIKLATGSSGLQAQVLDTASAVNYLSLSGAATTASPTLAVAGSDANISLKLAPKGTGSVVVPSGNVGIGTTAPARLLEVAGAVRFAPTAMPTSGQAGDMYVDVGASNSLKWYNGSNWLTVVDTSTGGGDFLKNGTVNMTGTLKHLPGTAAGPGLAFVGYTGTGMFETGTDILGLSTAGAERMRVDASGNVGIGTTAALNGTLDILGVSEILRRNSVDANGFKLSFRKDRASGTVVANDTVGSIEFKAHDGAAYQNLAQISAFVDGTPGAGDMPGALAFMTTPDGSATMVDRMRITPAGNVGIGETSPTRLLHVAGAMRLTPAAMPTSGQAGDIYVDQGASNSLKWYNGSNWLTVVDTSSGGGDFYKNGSVNMTGNLKGFVGTAAGPGYAFAGYTGTGMFETGTNIMGFSTAGAERMRVDASGQVGIGTTAPAAPLDVAGNISYSGTLSNGGSTNGLTMSGSGMATLTGGNSSTVQLFAIKNTSSLLGSKANLLFTGGALGLGSINTEVVVNDSDADMSFATMKASAATEKMRLTAAGNLGIGTTAPGALLDVSNAAAANASGQETLRLRAATATGAFLGSGPALNFYDLAGNNIGQVRSFTESAGNVGLSFGTYAGAFNQDRMHITAAGNVGIGISAPTRLLHVAGAMRLSPAAMPTSGQAGDMYVDQGASNSLKWYNGSNWLTVVDTSSGGGDFLKNGTIAMTGTLKHLPGTAAGPGLTFTGFTGTGMFETGTDILGFSTAGTERMRVLADGKVGIGTTTPGFPLDVVGDINASGNVSGSWIQASGNSGGQAGMLTTTNTNDAGFSGIYYYGSSTVQKAAILSAFSASNTDAYLGFSTRAAGAVAERMRIDNVGNVGIGTTAPDLPFLINRNGTLGSGTVYHIAGFTDSSYTKGVLLGYDSTGTNVATISADTSGAQSSTLVFRAADASGTGGERMRVLGTGNVGIGTTAPSSQLEVGATAGNDSSFGMSDADVAHGMTSVGATDTWLKVAPTHSTEGGASLYGMSDTANTTGMSVIGIIGSSAPTATIPSILLKGARKNTTSYQGMNAGDTVLQVANNTVPLMTMLGSGNLGLGTTTPARTLHVVGAMRLSPVAMPTSGLAGDMYIDQGASNALKFYNGSNWQTVATSTAGDFMANGTVNMTGTIKGLPGTAAGPGYSFVGYTGTGMFETGTNILGLSTAGSERIRVDASGNIGIGTTTTTDRFTLAYVSGDGNELHSFNEVGAGHGTTNGGLVLSNKYNNAGTLYEGAFVKLVQDSSIAPQGMIALGTGDGTTTTTRAVLNSSGNFGVGTTAPAARVHSYTTTTAGNASVEMLRLTHEDSDSAGSSGIGTKIVMTAESNSNGVFPEIGVIEAVLDDATNASKDSSLRFYTLGANAGAGSNTATEKMRIDSTGNLGIGTTTPTRLLHVAGPMRLTPATMPTAGLAGDMYIDQGASNALKFYNGSNWQTVGTSAGDFMKDGTVAMTGTLKGAVGTAAGPGYTFSGMTGTGMFETGTNILGFSTAGAEQLRIDASGNVGIGTTAPLGKFDIQDGDMNFRMPGGFDNAAVKSNLYWKNDLAGNMAWIQGGNPAVNTGYLAFGVFNNTEVMRIVSGGLVGIGTSTPSANLHLSPVSANGGTLTAFKVTAAANMNQTLSIEVPDMDINLARTVQWATGPLATQRSVKIQPQTLGFVGASTVTNAATVGITGAPTAGTNATITNTHALLISSSAVSTTTNSYGMTVNAQSGASNNYAAQFMGGNVGIGVSAPTRALHVAGAMRLTPATMPTAGLAGDMYIDQGASNALKFYNGSNWQTVGTSAGDFMKDGTVDMTGTLKAVYGTAAGPGFTFSGLTGTGIFQTGVSNMGFSTGGSERMRIDSSGNVGIGTTAPAAQLHIAATGVPSTLYLSSHGAADAIFDFRTSNGTNTAPTDVVNTDILGQMTFRGYRTNDYYIGGRIEAIVDGVPSGLLSPTKLAFSVNDGSTGNYERLTIKANGNVGIGATSPSSILSFGGTAARTIGVEANAAAAAGSQLTVKSGGAGAGTNILGGSLVLSAGDATGNGGSNIYFNVASSLVGGGSGATAASSFAYIDKNQRMGVGTTSALSTLHVEGSTSNLLRIARADNTAGNAVDTEYAMTNSTAAWKTYASTSGGITTNTNGSESGFFKISTIRAGTVTEAMRVMGTGRVGIGTTAPGAELHVVGDIQYTGVITDVSDARKKKNVKDLPFALDKITSIRGVSFVMKDDVNEETEIGVIAQEVEPVFPELVKTADDEMKSKSVNYIGFIGWIIEAIKELKELVGVNTAEVVALKQENTELKKTLSAMEERLQKLEQASQQSDRKPAAK